MFKSVLVGPQKPTLDYTGHCRCWLYSGILNLLRDLYEVQKLLERRRRGREWGRLARENKPVLLDIVKNSADVVLPLGALGILILIFLFYVLGVATNVEIICL